MKYTEQDIFLDRIDEPANAMRTDIDRDAIFELAQDIKKNGLINSITVRPVGDRFQVVAGHRRFLAHRYGGIATIRCVVRELNDDEAFAVMTSENLAREDVNPVDEAVHVGRLLEMYAGDVARVCEVTSRGRGWVDDRVAISKMPEDLKVTLREGKIKLGVALALNEITDTIDRTTCLQTALTHGASVLMAQYYAAQWKAGLFGSHTGNALPDSSLPPGEQKTVMLRCAVDGKEYPATDFVSFLVYRENAGYITAIREHLRNSPPEVPLQGGGSEIDSAPPTNRGAETT